MTVGMKADVRTDPRQDATSTTPVGSRRRSALGALTAVSLVALVILALFVAPEDAAQGAAQRIFYIHVPSAWVGFLAFFVVFVASIRFLQTGDRRFDDLASASAAVGMVFTTAVLLTGPLWGRPVWGVYWTWDPRLTSFLLLWLIYLSYLVLRGYVPEPERRARYSAVVGIVGFLDVPIVYLSVRWWRAQHPSQLIFTRGGLPASMLVVLLIGVAAFTLLYVYLLSVRLSVTRLEHEREEAPG
ncbi:MAG: cytochrome c biogenesis protein CcsA [Actinomycetota bacterium]